VSVSPDGRNVYVTAAGARGGVAVFARDAAAGALTQLSGASGCVSEAADPTSGCAVGRGLGNELAVVLSADGRFAYVSSESNAFSGGGIAAFARDPNSGALTELPGSAGCLSASRLEGCAALRGLTGGAGALALSPDGETLYATAPQGAAGGSLAVFDRDPATGALAQLRGRAACANRSGRRGCARARGLTAAMSVAVSADGRHTYVAGSGLAVFSRSARTGALRQSKGRAACVGRRRRDRCAHARGEPGKALALSADGGNLYALGGGVATFARSARTGALRQLPGRHGCIAALPSCRRGRALDSPLALTLSTDDASLYVAAFGSAAIAVFSRRAR
jgi:6-phosphogluconolactonase (cycloisomerase 2 family)